MSKKQFLVFGKLWLLLLLFCQPVEAKANCALKKSQDVNIPFFTAADSLNEDMLQPQAMSLRVLSEHSVKQVSFGEAVMPYVVKPHLGLRIVVSSIANVQDENRCESVSCLLFPYHIFW